MENFMISNLRLNSKIEFMDNKTLFIGKIVKTAENFFGVIISRLKEDVRDFYTDDSIDYFIVLEREAFWCRSTVMGYKTNNVSQLLILSEPEVLNKIERRKSPRIPVILDVEYGCLPEDIDKLSKITQMHQRIKKKSFTLDISKGGMAFITYEKIEKGTVLHLSFNLKENIFLLGKVVRSEPNEGKPNFRTAIEFCDVDMNNQNVINFYVDEKAK